jgi:phage/plasmid primase-like uncharacterized protein
MKLSIMDLISAMHNNGINVDNIIIDNKIHRCTEVNGRSKHKKPCWYIVFDNGESLVAIYGNYKNNSRYVWSNKLKLNIKDKLLMTKKIDLIRQKQIKEQQQSLIKLRNVFDNECIYLNNFMHPYIVKKQITSLLEIDLRYKLKVDVNNNLLVPIYNIQGILMGYQKISALGDKMFAKGTLKKGNYYPIMTTSVNFSDVDIIAVGEGLATTASVYTALTDLYGNNKIACLVAFDVGNIEAVLLQLWSNHINKSIILVADNDIANTTNIGVNTCINIQNKYRHKPINVFIPHEVQSWVK